MAEIKKEVAVEMEGTVEVERRDISTICKESIEVMNAIMGETKKLKVLSMEMEMYTPDELLQEPLFAEVLRKTYEMAELQSKLVEEYQEQ